MRDGIDYEFTIVFDINMKHQTIASKDRTNLFIGKPDFYHYTCYRSDHT